jgi:hypothetical protein
VIKRNFLALSLCSDFFSEQQQQPMVVVAVINALWQIAGIFLTLATYNIKHKTLHYYANAFLKKLHNTICYN